MDCCGHCHCHGHAFTRRQWMWGTILSSVAAMLAGGVGPRGSTAAAQTAEATSCACRKSNPNILVVQPAQDRAAKNGPGQFDGARDRRILLQR